MATFSLDDVRAVCKRRDAWWTVLLVDPLAIRLTRLVANRTSITPDRLTITAFVFGLGAACCFVVAQPWALLTGAALYHLSFILDCVDGKVARLKGTGTFFGAWLDYMLDRLRVLACGVGLVAGLFFRTGDPRYLFLGFVILFLDMFRYANALHVSKTRMTMGLAIAERQGTAVAVTARPSPEPAESVESMETVTPAAVLAAAAAEDAERDGFRVRYPLYGTFCEFLVRHRVRVHLFSGVEFQMFVFIVAPALAAIIGAWVMFPVAAGSGLLLGLFELMVIYRLWVSARHAERVLNRDPAVVAAGGVGGVGGAGGAGGTNEAGGTDAVGAEDEIPPVPQPRPMTSVAER